MSRPLPRHPRWPLLLVLTWFALTSGAHAATDGAVPDPATEVRPVHDASLWDVAQGPLRAYWDEWKVGAGVDDSGHATAPPSGAVQIGGYRADEVPVPFRAWVIERAARDGILVVGNSWDVPVAAAQEAARAAEAARQASDPGATGGPDDPASTGTERGGTTEGGSGTSGDDSSGSGSGWTEGPGNGSGPEGTDPGATGGDPGATTPGTTGGTASRTPTEYPYGSDHERQKLDVYLPAGQGPFPLIVFFHGGGFYRGDKKEVDDFLPMLDRGYGMVAVNYKLDKDPAAAADDARKAVAFLRAKISEDPAAFPFDPARIASAGASAGGYLAALLGANGSKHGAAVGAVIDLAGPTDFKTFVGQLFYNAHQGPRTFAFKVPDGLGDLSGALKGITGRALGSDYSVLDNVSPSHPPTLIRHGKDDPIIPLQQSARYAQALQKAGVYVWYEVVDAAHGLTPELKAKIMEQSDQFLQCRKVFGSGECPGN